MSCLIQDVCVLYAVKGHWVGSVEWMQLASQRPWKVELKSMTVDPTSELRSHQFSFWGATCGIGYRRRDFEILIIWSRFAECILLLPFLFFGSFAWRHCGDSFHVRGRARDFKQKPCEGGQGCDLDLAMVPFPEKPVRCFEDAHQKTICFAVLPDIVCVLGWGRALFCTWLWVPRLPLGCVADAWKKLPVVQTVNKRQTWMLCAHELEGQSGANAANPVMVGKHKWTQTNHNEEKSTETQSKMGLGLAVAKGCTMSLWLPCVSRTRERVVIQTPKKGCKACEALGPSNTGRESFVLNRAWHSRAILQLDLLRVSYHESWNFPAGVFSAVAVTYSGPRLVQ